MAVIANTRDRIAIDRATIEEAQSAVQQEGAQGGTLVIRHPDGTEHVLPRGIERVLMNTLEALATNGSVSIGQMPEELTSTVAADVLSVSRPTLMKWAKDGDIPSFLVGSHRRFHRDDVLSHRKKLASKRQTAFEKLRALDAELEEQFED